MPHVLNLFNADSLEQKMSLGNPPVAEIRRLWDLSEDNPAYDCYPLQTDEQVDFVEQYSGVKINRERLGDYQLGFDS